MDAFEAHLWVLQRKVWLARNLWPLQGETGWIGSMRAQKKEEQEVRKEGTTSRGRLYQKHKSRANYSKPSEDQLYMEHLKEMDDKKYQFKEKQLQQQKELREKELEVEKVRIEAEMMKYKFLMSQSGSFRAAETEAAQLFIHRTAQLISVLNI